jgi:hypothetical protein
MSYNLNFVQSEWHDYDTIPGLVSVLQNRPPMAHLVLLWLIYRAPCNGLPYL